MPSYIRVSLPLFCASAFTLGGLIPLFAAEHAIRETGLPPSASNSPPAQSIMILSSGRMTAIGLMLFSFYSQAKYSEIDTILLCTGWVGCIDGYVCWKEGVPGRAAFRFISGCVIAAWGWFGVTAGGSS